MKKFFTSLFLIFILFSITSCGGGSGSSSSPPGEDPDVPFSVELRPSQYVVQTNGFIYMKARVLNGNGNPISNYPVYFTNLSSLGTLSATSANTDSSGYATVTASSTSYGFMTVQAEVDNGTGQVRDRKTVYFSTYDLVLLPYMILEVDGELNDYTLFESTTDNQVIVTATVFDRYGQTEFGSDVLFGTDWPYRIGSSGTCSDGSSSCGVWFPLGNTATTDISGHASVMVQVDPIILTDITTVLNITALADNGAAGIVSLFLQPVTVSSVTVSAVPSVVAPEGTSTITAAVTLNTGGPAPDNTTVSFTTCEPATCTTPTPVPCGAITPFAQTTDGATTGVTFTAPSKECTCTITATAGGVSGTTDVLVTTALTVQPGTQSIVGAAGGTAIYTIFGGVAGYTVTSSNPDVAFNDDGAGGGTADDGVRNGTEGGTWTVAASGDSFTVTVPAGAPTGSVTLTVRDSAGTTVTATLTIAAAPAITVVPGSYSVTAGVAVGRVFTITGGAPPYIINSSNPSAVYDSAPGDGVWTVAASGGTFTANVSATVCPGTTTLTVYDTAGGSKTATIVIVGSPIVVTTTSPTICENTANCIPSTPTTATFTITGGLPPYFTTSSDSAVILSPGATNPFTVDAILDSITADTTITFTISDSCATPKTASILVINEP